MNIVVVVDLYDLENNANGTVMTAKRFVDALKARGNRVKVVAVGAKGEDCYEVPEHYMPIVSEISRKQQIRFGTPVVETLVNAFQGADVIHFILPFKLERKGRKIAEQMGIPYTAAFHCQPENVSYNCGMGWSRLFPKMIYTKFRLDFYRHFSHIHCPSMFIADQLRKNRYKAKLHVISNGVDAAFRPDGEITPIDPDYISILMVGRLAHEKRQDVLIKAVGLSKYADKIHLTLAGRGPREKMLRGLARKHCVNPVTFGFYNQAGLIDVIRSSDLYVHAADVEIEAISCIEAFACGTVPIIANAKKSATPQFALDDRSLFKAGSAKDLARKIDYWIEHDAERMEMSLRYVEQGKRYRLDYSIDKTEEMFNEAITDHRARAKLSSKEHRRLKRKFGRKNWLSRAWSWFVYYVVAVPILAFGTKLSHGVKVKGKRNLYKTYKTGAVAVCNHVHMMDAPINARALFNKKVIFTALESNFRIPVAGKLLKMLGAIPVPENFRELPSFFRETKRVLKKKRIVHMYPEGHLINYYAGLREFSRGAFVIACDAQVPILPVVISWRPRRGFYKLFSRTGKPCATVTICPPVTPDYLLMKREMENDLLDRTRLVMQEAYDASNNGNSVDYYRQNNLSPSEYHLPSERQKIAEDEDTLITSPIDDTIPVVLNVEADDLGIGV